MASSSAIPSSASSSSSTTSTPSAARVPSETENPRLATRAAAPAGSAAPDASAMASSSSTPSSTSSSTTSTRSAAPPNLPQALPEQDWPELGTRAPVLPRTRAAAPPTDPARAHGRGGGGRRCWNSEGSLFVLGNADLSMYIEKSKTAANPTSTDEGSSSSASALSAPSPSSNTMASTGPPPPSASSTTTPSRDITLVPNASGAEPAEETSAHTAPGPNASTSAAPGVKTTANLPQEPGALTSASSSAPKIDDASLESASETAAEHRDFNADGHQVMRSTDEGSSASASSAPSPSSSTATSTPTDTRAPSDRAPEPPALTSAALRDNWERYPALYPNPMWRYRRGEAPPVSWCLECRLRPAVVGATPCGHLALCGSCYDATRFVCPSCGQPVTRWLDWHR